MPRQDTPPQHPLFRPEAVQEKHANHLGQVLIHQPRSHTLIGLLALLLVLLALSFVLLGTHTRKATTPGLLIPDQGVLRILAPTQGQLLKIQATEGDPIKAGDPLFILSDERVSIQGGLQALVAKQLMRRKLLVERNQQQAQDRLDRQQELLQLRLQAMQLEENQLLAEVELLEQREQLAQNSLERLQRLSERGHVAISEVQRAETELLALTSQKQTIKRNQTGLERDRLTLLAQRREAEIQYQQDMADAEHSLALLQQEIAENQLRSHQILQAPFDGKLTGINVQPGQQVSVNSLMASLIPQDSQLQAHLYITPRQAGFIEPGQLVQLRYAAYPYQKFGMGQGRVINVADSPYSIHELQPHIASTLQGTGTLATGEVYYRVTVALESQQVQVYGKAQSLRPGMLLEADILQDKRRIYEWILEPVYSVTRKM